MFELLFILSYSANPSSFLFSMRLQDLVQGFDQEVAAVVMARLASYKMEMEVTLMSYMFGLQLNLSYEYEQTLVLVVLLSYEFDLKSFFHLCI